MKRFGYGSSEDLDALFAALADPTRRAILVRLTEGEASVGELAEPFAMSQPAISKRPARLNAAPMAEAVAWISAFRKFWDGSFDQLDGLLADLQSKGDPS